MRFDHDTNYVPSDPTHNVHNNMPIAGYSASDSMPQPQGIINNMMYYQGIYCPLVKL